MGRLFLVAGIAILAMSAPANANPGHSQGGKTNGAAGGEPSGFGAGGCPPGLRSKNPACMPPGQYKKLFEIGQRVPSGYRGLMSYEALPYDLRMGYGGALDPKARYVYDQHFIYRVDPTTMIVRQVLRAVIGY
jgi:hypothetical protein